MLRGHSGIHVKHFTFVHVKHFTFPTVPRGHVVEVTYLSDVLVWWVIQRVRVGILRVPQYANQRVTGSIPDQWTTAEVPLEQNTYPLTASPCAAVACSPLPWVSVCCTVCLTVLSVSLIPDWDKCRDQLSWCVYTLCQIDRFSVLYSQ